MKRRQFLLNGAAATAAVTSPSFLGLSLPTWGSSDTLTQAALDLDLETFGSDGDPSFMFHYAGDEEREKLLDWADSNGEVKRDLETVNMMAISASWEDIGLSDLGYGAASIGQLSGGVQANDYVDYIDANTTHEIPTPINELDDDSSWSLGSFDMGPLQTISMFARTLSTSPAPAPDGLAFDGDAPETPLEDSRTHVRAGDSVISGVDTSGLTVAVIDTGINDGSMFGDRILSESTDFSADDDPTGVDAVSDGDGHGTWVAACIAGSNGFAPDADILGLKVLGDDGSGETADIVAGVEKAIDVGADVACLSLGAPNWSQALADALTEARNAGVFCAVAVGNDRYASVFVNSPADASAGFGVQACNVPEGDRDETKLAYFGNIGEDPGSTDLSEGKSEGASPLLAAPGMAITIELPSGPSTLSGTSMAAPHVTGGAALLRADGHDVDETWDRLLEHAYPLPSAGETEARHGLIDVEASLNDTEPENSPEDVRTDEAAARDDFNDLLSTVL